MKNQPLVMGILMGAVVVFVIVIVSLGVKLKEVYVQYNDGNAVNIELQRDMEEQKGINASLEVGISTLKNEKTELQELIKSLSEEIEAQHLEIEKLERLKDKLEESLKEELIKD